MVAVLALPLVVSQCQPACAPATSPAPCPETWVSASAYPLRHCQAGWPVIVMAQRLQALGYLPSGETSWEFDDHVLGAVLRFQADHGLVVDGLVGRLTWRALDVGQHGPDRDANGIVDPYEVELDSNAPPCPEDPTLC